MSGLAFDEGREFIVLYFFISVKMRIIFIIPWLQKNYKSFA